MTRAQIHAQVLVYILAIVVMGIVLTFGYRMIKDMQENNEEAVFIDFTRKVRSSVDDMEYDLGSQKRKTFNVPSGIAEVCFVDLDQNPSISPIIDDSVSAGVNRNVFLCPPCTQSFYAGNITADGGYVCLNTSGGRLSVWFEGLAREVKISAEP